MRFITYKYILTTIVMFDVDKCEWFEIQQECTQCGQSFIADFKYNSVCSKCRHPEVILETEIEDED